MKVLLLVVLLAVFAMSASAQPDCNDFYYRIRDTPAASKIEQLCASGLQAWFCPCFGGITVN